MERSPEEFKHLKCYHLCLEWKCSAANALASAILDRLLQRLLGLSSSAAVLGRDALTDSKSNLDSTDNGRSSGGSVFSSIGSDSKRSLKMLNLEVIEASNDSCSNNVALICCSTCLALKTCDADIGRIGGGAWECPALGLLSDTLSRNSRDSKR